MSPPIQYPTAELERVMRMSRSMRQAAARLGMSLGALRKRALNDERLRPIALACIERGRGFRFRKSEL